MNAPQDMMFDDDAIVELRAAGDGYKPVTVGDIKGKMRQEGTDALFYTVRDEWRDAEGRKGDNVYARFDFVRDCTERMVAEGSVTKIIDELDRLKRMGAIEEHLDLYDHEHFITILEAVGDIVDDDDEWKTRGLARRIFDAAPNLYIYQELLKRTNKLIEEDFTSLNARSIFPVLQLNTWLANWDYSRIVEEDFGLPQYMDPENVPSASGRQAEKREAVLRKLVFMDRAASWTFVELQRYAEAVANGAPRISLDTKRVARARRALMHWENVLAFFGDDIPDIRGLLSAQAKTKIPRQAATQKFGSGANAEEDRRLLVDFVAKRIDTTEDILKPNFLGLPTKAWLWLIKSRYGSLAADNNQTIEMAAMDSLRRMGISSITLVPELGYRQVEADRLQKKGVPQAEAERVAGGLNKEDVMLIMRRDPEVLEMIVGKDVTMYPGQEEVRGRTETRMLLSAGGVEPYKPEGIELVTNIGPDSLFT